MKRFIQILLLFHSLVLAHETLTFGVFSSKTYEDSIKEYQPLVDYLNQNLQEYTIKLSVYDREGMEEALQKNQIDILTTNPSHYEVIRNNNLLTRIIATTQHQQNGINSENLGGVIFTSATNQTVHSLSDLLGKKIASMDTKSLGAYQAQVYECMQHDLDIRRFSKIQYFEQQNEIVKDVLSGKSDVGFIRTGVLESMVKEGKIQLHKIRIINRQNMTYFPYIVSTRLYPEWPIAIMPHVNEELAKQLTLLLLNYDPSEKSKSSIGGFILPQNYQSVTELIKTLHLPPYDKLDSITWDEIYIQYKDQIVAALFGVILLVIVMIQIIRLTLRLRSSEERFSLAIEGTQDGLFDWNMVTNEMFHSKNFETMLGYDGDELPQTIHAWRDNVHPDDLEQALKTVNDYLLSRGSINYVATFRMRTKDGSWKWIEGKGKALFNAKGIPIRFVGFNTDITEKKENEFKLEYAAAHDSLTDLPNRNFLNTIMPQMLSSVKRHETNLAFLFIDLDGFKEVNDLYGHDVGDLLLKEASTRMKSLLRGEDIVARLGGDEFALVISNLHERNEVSYLVVRLLKIISEPYFIENQELHVSASIGISFYPQLEETNFDMLLRQADQAMYTAKFNGKNQYCCYDDLTENLKKEGNGQLSKILLALENEEFILHYQPIVNMQTGKILGAEVLIRWNNPEQGLLYPQHFFPFIEYNSAMYDLDLWVLNHTFQQISHFHTLRFGKDMRFSINLSAYTFTRSDFIATLEQLFSTYSRVSPSQIELEILETNALNNIEEVQKIIASLHEMGITVALDDFGTGYASIAYLKMLNVDYLKLDRSFIMDILEDAADLRILEASIGLGEAFRSSVIAEGVESQAHGDLLVQFGCFIAQGYAIAKPMEPQAFIEWSATWKPFSSWQELSPVPHRLLPFLYAGTEHRRWFNDLKAFIHHRSDEPPQQDHTLCQFGKWLHSEGKYLFNTSDDYHELTNLHRKMHDASKTLVNDVTKGGRFFNVQNFDHIDSLHKEMIDYLQKMVKKSLNS